MKVGIVCCYHSSRCVGAGARSLYYYNHLNKAVATYSIRQQLPLPTEPLEDKDIRINSDFQSQRLDSLNLQ